MRFFLWSFALILLGTGFGLSLIYFFEIHTGVRKSTGYSPMVFATAFTCLIFFIAVLLSGADIFNEDGDKENQGKF